MVAMAERTPCARARTEVGSERKRVSKRGGRARDRERERERRERERETERERRNERENEKRE